MLGAPTNAGNRNEFGEGVDHGVLQNDVRKYRPRVGNPANHLCFQPHVELLLDGGIHHPDCLWVLEAQYSIPEAYKGIEVLS